MFGVMKKIRHILYRLLLWNEEADEYKGYEEQGLTYDDWKLSKNGQFNPLSIQIKNKDGDAKPEINQNLSNSHILTENLEQST